MLNKIRRVRRWLYLATEDEMYEMIGYILGWVTAIGLAIELIIVALAVFSIILMPMIVLAVPVLVVLVIWLACILFFLAWNSAGLTTNAKRSGRK